MRGWISEMACSLCFPSFSLLSFPLSLLPSLSLSFLSSSLFFLLSFSLFSFFRTLSLSLPSPIFFKLTQALSYSGEFNGCSHRSFVFLLNFSNGLIRIVKPFKKMSWRGEIKGLN